MARIDDLLTQVSDATLRQKLEAALADMKRRQRFGLVFEDHVPETTALVGAEISVGAIVQKRRDPDHAQLYVVRELALDGKATIEPDGGGPAAKVQKRDLLAVRRFGEPIYPALTSLGAVRRGGDDRPHHALINGENFHALQLLVYLYEGKVDCIYIDPPYNTGAKDWKYNNHYVDKNDAWRHSKWLSMMEKRLALARRLLKPDGVLICTIDEHEANHLGMLLEKLFPSHLHYMITIVINPKGREKSNFAPVEEFAFFVVPNVGADVIVRAPGRTDDAEEIQDDEGGNAELSDGADDDVEPGDIEAPLGAGADPEWEIRHARRRGGGAERSSYREKRAGQFYPIYIDEVAKRVVSVGQAIPLEAAPDFARVNGLRPIWPIDKAGDHRVWGFIPATMERMIEDGNVLLGSYHKNRDDWTINYRVPKKNTRKLKTVWWEKSHDAGTHGSSLLTKMLGYSGAFPFPKSVYAVKDCLAAAVRDRPNALILDFFAGSGTTFHATCLLNAEDGGQRRSILVTNNEVDERTTKSLNKAGHFRGDPEFEAVGIFNQATRPRCEAVVLGQQPGGKPIPGKYLGGRAMAEGFEENIEFFRLDYLDPDEVDLGGQFEAIFPSLWLGAQGVGVRGPVSPTASMLVGDDLTYAVLFDEAQFRKFRIETSKMKRLKSIWIVTDSDDAFAEMRSALPSRVDVSMLYRDYLRNFRINTRHNL